MAALVRRQGGQHCATRTEICLRARETKREILCDKDRNIPACQTKREILCDKENNVLVPQFHRYAVLAFQCP